MKLNVEPDFAVSGENELLKIAWKMEAKLEVEKNAEELTVLFDFNVIF